MKQTQSVVICEGYVDLIKAWSAGVNNAVATLGTALTAAHAQLLRRHANRVVICFDADQAGQAATVRTIELLSNYDFYVKIAQIPDGKDPDEFIEKHGANAFHQQVLAQTISPTRFRLLQAKRKYRIQDESERIRYINEAMVILADVTSPTERELYMQDLASEFSVPMNILKQELQESLQKQNRKVRSHADHSKEFQSLSQTARPEIRKGQEVALLPAYHRAERMLLALMIDSADVTQQVMYEIGDQFYIEEHAAIAAHLYAFYSSHPHASSQSFVFQLEDDKLQEVATAIMMLDDVYAATNEQVLVDYIREVKKFPLVREVKLLQEQLVEAEKADDFALSLELSAKITELNKLLKQSV
jgi:DNA primase